MRVTVRAAFCFGSKTALQRGLRAFDAAAYPEFFDAGALQVTELTVRVDRSFEIEADCDAWPAFRDLSAEAAEGAVALRIEGEAVEDLRLAFHPGPQEAGTKRRWELATTTSGTPSGEAWLVKVRSVLRAHGLDAPEPERMDLVLLAAPQTPAVWKALMGTCGVGLAEAKALTADLPRRVLRRAEPGRAEAARVALSSAGAEVTIGPAG